MGGAWHQSEGGLAVLRHIAGLLLQGTVVLGARDTAFSAAPGRAGAEAPALAGGHAALVTAIQVNCALWSMHTILHSRGCFKLQGLCGIGLRGEQPCSSARRCARVALAHKISAPSRQGVERGS